jgi:hypothetical protein
VIKVLENNNALLQSRNKRKVMDKLVLSMSQEIVALIVNLLGIHGVPAHAVQVTHSKLEVLKLL